MTSYEVEVSYLRDLVPNIDKLFQLPGVRCVVVERVGFGTGYRLRVLTRYPTKEEMAAAFDRGVMNKKAEAVRTLIDGKPDIGVESI